MSQDPTDLLTALQRSVDRARALAPSQEAPVTTQGPNTPSPVPESPPAQTISPERHTAGTTAGRTLSDDEHAAMVERTLSAVSTTCAELGITPADVEALDYEPPGATGPHACLTLDLADGRRVQIAKDGLGRREFTWTPARPAIPEPARVELDAVRERLAEVRGGRRTLGRGPVVNPPTVADVDGRIVVAWPAERGIVEVYPEAIEGWAETVNGLRADVERLTAERDGWEPLTAALNRSLDFERAEVARLHADLAGPNVTIDFEGERQITLDWPEGAERCLMTRAHVEGIVAEFNRLHAREWAEEHVIRIEAPEEIERLRALVARYARWVEVCEGTDFLDREPWELDDAFTAEDLAELLRIRREAGLT